jgi:hypothetical protein
MHARFWFEILKGGYLSENVGIDRLILKLKLRMIRVDVLADSPLVGSCVHSSEHSVCIKYFEFLGQLSNYGFAKQDSLRGVSSTVFVAL